MKYTWLSFLLNWKQVLLSHGHASPHRNINSHDKQTLLPFNASISCLYEVQHGQQSMSVMSQSSKLTRPCLVYWWRGRTSKGGRENERGHFSLGPGVKLTGDLRALWTSLGSLICWIAGRRSGRAGQIGGTAARVRDGDRNRDRCCETEGAWDREAQRTNQNWQCHIYASHI